MRPIKLVMTAFGPYSDVEVVDFGELNEKKLFLITGATGSGKTTLFDAISYAMYGQASGDLRTGESLRSQFAPDDRLTEVTLEFELKGMIYYVQRSPKQYRPKSRGEGLTEHSPKATLTIYDGDPKTIITGVKHVNDKIESVVGINAEQFKQIMMIPQGEFRKLLVSDSQEREKVLQKLFDTSIYNTIQFKLDMQAKKQYGVIKEQKIIRDTHISGINCTDEEQLKELIKAEDRHISEIIVLTEVMMARDQDVCLELNQHIQQAQKKVDTHIVNKEKAKEMNHKIEQREQTRIKLEAKRNRSDEMLLVGQKVESAEKALLIAPTEEQYGLRKDELLVKQNELEKCFIKIQTSENNLEKIKNDFEKTQSTEAMAKREARQETLVKLKSYKSKVEQIEAVKASIVRTRKLFNKSDEAREHYTTFIEKSNKTLAELREQKDIAHKAGIMYLEKREAYTKIERVLEKLNKKLELQNSLKNEQVNYKKQDTDRERMQVAYQVETDDYKRHKINFFMNQAAILAKELEEGEPCPVCGSTVHVELAQFLEGALSEEALEAKEVNLKILEENYNNKCNDIARLEERIRKLTEQDTELNNELEDALSKGSLETLIRERVSGIKQLKKEEKDLYKLSKTLETITKELEQLLHKVQKTEEEKVENEGIHASLSKELTTEETNLESIYADVPEAIRTIKALTEAIQKTIRLKEAEDKKLELARNRFDQARADLLEVTTLKGQLERSIVVDNDNIKKVKEALEAKIITANFADLIQYSEAKLSEATIKTYKNQLKEYEQTLHLLKQQYADLLMKTKDSQVVDMAFYDEKIAELYKTISLLTDDYGTVKSKIDNNTQIIKEVVKIGQEIGKQEKSYNIIGHLAKIAQGNNKVRMTFERYVLAAFLEDILVAANIRLKKMTQGRYLLSRTAELQRKNKQSGLELEVYDHYTGKSRHVKTLSGGESFKASLSMALGLSDVVQSYAGGVKLDTMFIDEGFGTLDQESLDSAINCLIDLQNSGRLVGIISHVQELKERIDTRLEVHSSSHGSYTKFVGV